MSTEIVTAERVAEWHPGVVPRFTPFAALRYSASSIDDLIAPPYDVLSPRDLDELNAASDHNITHIDVPRESDGPDRYERAAATMRRWIDEGVLVADPVPDVHDLPHAFHRRDGRRP